MTRLRAAAPLLVAAVLAGVALFTVSRAGCDDPGRYLVSPAGYEFVGGCIAPDDIIVKTPVTVRPTAPAKG